jgi:2-dehydropantoate 2-reductase
VTEPLRVCIVGCGAIGSLFAAHLGRLPDVEVWAYDVSPDHVREMSANGVRVTGAADFVSRVRATSDPASIPPCRLGIVAVKSEHTAAAIEATASVFSHGAVASVQNGLGNEERIAQFVPHVIRGTTLAAGAITAPGAVRYDAEGGTWLGPFEPRPAAMQDVSLLADLLQRGGMPATALADARGAQWTKLLFNVGTNALGAVTGLPIGPIGTDGELRRLASRLIDEGRRVAGALGITLDADPEAMIDDAVARAHGHRASMLQDIAARRRTEVDVLNGGIVAVARDVGVDVPLNEAMVALVHGIEASWRLAEPHPGRGTENVG